uniref:Major facilitator superfamily (MFS) profile domain-containing protein n=1 Tax=Ciona savignyi TaxID=51511 RepID=H2YYN6_CIOSA
QKVTFPLVLAVIVTVMGSTFQYGYNIAVVNAPAPVNYCFNLTEINQVAVVEVTTLSDSDLILWSFTVSIYTVGGMIGSFSTGFFVKKFGRKAANSLEMIIIARFLLGIFAGICLDLRKSCFRLDDRLATGVVPLYLGEISPKAIRGALGVISQLSITIGRMCGQLHVFSKSINLNAGILTAQLLSLKEVLGTAELWPILLAFTGVPSAMQLCVLPFLPESPRCLLIDRDREDLARKALIKFRGTSDVAVEIREMRHEAEAQASTDQLSVLEVLKDQSVRWQIISIAFIQFTQQMCGINAIFFYLNTIFEAAGVAGDTQNYASVGVGTVNVFMTVISVLLTYNCMAKMTMAQGNIILSIIVMLLHPLWNVITKQSVLLMDRLGRKILLAGGYAIAGVFCIVMTISLNLQDQISWISNLSIASVIGFIIGFANQGVCPVPWILTAELFRQSSRPAASSIGCGVNWTFNFALALVFPFMQKGMGPYVFLFFLCICAIATAYVVIIIPETKGKTFQEINNMFVKR